MIKTKYCIISKIFFSIMSLCILFSKDNAYSFEKGDIQNNTSWQLISVNINRHVVQYHAVGRARSGNYEFGCSTYFTIKVPGNSIQEARINGLPKAKKKAKGLLLKEAKKRYKDSKIIRWDVK